MAVHIKGKGLTRDTNYEPGIKHQQGICSKTIENIDPPFTLQHVIKPPGHVGSAHYHIHCARGTLVLKGRLRHFHGPLHNQQIFESEAGDYIYTPKGEIHYTVNLSDTESVEFVTTYVGVTDVRQSGKVVVEPNPKH